MSRGSNPAANAPGTAIEPVWRRALRPVARWFEGTPSATRSDLVFRVVLSTLALVVALSWGVHRYWPLLKPAPRPVTHSEDEQTRYGLTLERRKQIFEFMATREPAAIAAGKRDFPTHAWSQQDHRAHFEHDNAKRAERQFGVSLATIFAVMQEGIHKKWRANSKAEPLIPTIIPLDPRR